ncbi:MAG: ankyrin repeat domain-containing protein [Anaerolineae bacterium]|nr:ankyrin repeat domain-containing protein [Phycisphaerae bacterium]
MEKEIVRAFVGAGHSDLDKTRSMLDEHPRVLNAVVDHGNGDFEAAIGGAGHMGRRDIAQFLIDRGARFDIFVAAMMGKLEIVKAAIEAFPSAKNSLGPHGIDLLTHAEKGKSTNVIEYLQSLG